MKQYATCLLPPYRFIYTLYCFKHKPDYLFSEIYVSECIICVFKVFSSDVQSIQYFNV